MKNVLLAAVFMSGCGVSQANVDSRGDGMGEETAELSTTSRTYVALRHDSGGYYVHDVNRVTLSETHVSGFDFSSSILGDHEQQQVLSAADGEVVLRGKLGAKNSHGVRSFVVSDAWRGMPGAAAATGDLVFAAKPISIECFAAPCATMQVKKANATATTNFHQLDVGGVGHVVNSDWLSSNALNGALVAGTVTTVPEARGEMKLAVSQVFLPLPFTLSSCPVAQPASCSSSQVRPWVRGADLCFSFEACRSTGICNYLVPNCGDGYSTVSYRGTNGCNKVECDPTWIYE